ncbi:MAG: hypothetical protein HYX72_13210 [Acidobacteria bacterium]|nr:hypothetical protein [Acidobacteriota bacterium]
MRHSTAPRWWVYNLFQWGDDLSVSRGRHALKFGSNFEPRAGLAFQFTSRTVLRAGAGIYHDQLLPFVYARNTFTGPPYSGLMQVFQPSFPAGFARSGDFTRGSLATMNWQSQAPAKYQYNVSLEQQLWKGAVAQLAYIGATANHLWGYADRNTPFPAILATGEKFRTGILARRNPNWGQITLIEPEIRN